MDEIKKINLFTKFLTPLTFCLLLVGNTVRNMKAGLSCPDWPLCFGQLVPKFNTLVYYEFSHRVFAGAISILFLIVLFKTIRLKGFLVVKMLCYLALIVLISQVILGGLTVTRLLAAHIVAMHLTAGVTFFSLLASIWFVTSKIIRSTQDKFGIYTPRTFKFLTGFCLFAVYCQTILGGLVASNYAGLVCEGFPTCNGFWWPEFRGLIAIQMSHRIGALTVTLLSFAYLAYYISSISRPWMVNSIVKTSRLILWVLAIQVCIGISNVYFQIPIALSILHLAFAAILISLYLKILIESLEIPV